MSASFRNDVPRFAPAVLGAPVVLYALTFVFPVAAQGDPGDGQFLTVTSPITSQVLNDIKNETARARARKVTKIVFDFNPQSRNGNVLESSSPDFGPCFDLAKFIREQHDLLTIAYVHQKVHRHSVLPVLACKEIVMSSAAALGPVEPDENAPRYKFELDAYREFAGSARTAIVMKMLDSSIEVMEGRKNNAAHFFDRREQAEATAAGVVGIKPEPVMRRGMFASLNQDDAERFGFCKLKNKETSQQVAEAYGMGASAIKEDPLQGRDKAWRIVLKGQVDVAFREKVTRRIKRAIGDGANTIVFHFEDCGGGSTEIARALAEEIRGLKDRDNQGPVRTIAFIPRGAPDTATFLAFACNEIVMAKVEGQDATIGDFSAVVNPKIDGRRRRALPNPVDAEAVRKDLRDLAQSQGISPILVDGMFQADLEIFRARAIRGGDVERRIMTAAELEADRSNKEPQWQAEEQVKHKGTLLKLDYDAARRYGVARHVVDNPDDLTQVYNRYGIVGKVKEAKSDWLDSFAEFLRNGWVAVLLVTIGLFCVVLEVKIPGATVPGVIAALCFVLFFWAHWFNSEIIILAILLFLLGLVLIGIEVFVLPGFGFVGVSGIILLVLGLGLATIEKMPGSGSEWMGFGKTLMQFGVGLVVAAFGAIILARYLPHIPIANRMMLAPPSDKTEGGEGPAPLPGMEQAAALLGAVGTAATTLRPAGMVKFGEQFVDVVTEGGFIPAGARVQVTEVEGNRIVVKEV